MPNQINYPDTLISTNQVRPSRISSNDLSIIKTGETPVIFGETLRDNVELYVYNDTGVVVGHINIGPTDPLISLTKRVDDISAVDYVNLDMVGAFKKAKIQPGRYTLTTNFFRNEVGSEAGYKLYIAEISPSRTEVRLRPVSIDSNVVNDVFEFATPSVSPEFAQGLIDQVFRVSQNFTDSDSLTLALIESIINTNDISNNVEHGTISRINYAGLMNSFYKLYTSLLPLIREHTLDILASHISDVQVQDVELLSYLSDGITQALNDLSGAGMIDKHFNLV